ncbi:hypothetical protein BZA77DRAFT_85827 [Pyronema omphalodes]|nr:hypothetical protein BZA77DRAFT_85827 [Pyronema omphalodes]
MFACVVLSCLVHISKCLCFLAWYLVYLFHSSLISSSLKTKNKKRKNEKTKKRKNEKTKKRKKFNKQIIKLLFFSFFFCLLELACRFYSSGKWNYHGSSISLLFLSLFLFLHHHSIHSPSSISIFHHLSFLNQQSIDNTYSKPSYCLLYATYTPTTLRTLQTTDYKLSVAHRLIRFTQQFTS